MGWFGWLVEWVAVWLVGVFVCFVLFCVPGPELPGSAVVRCSDAAVFCPL